MKLLRVPEFKIRESITILYDRYFFETFLIMHNIEIWRNIYYTRKSQHTKYTPRGRNTPIIVGTVKWIKMCSSMIFIRRVAGIYNVLLLNGSFINQIGVAGELVQILRHRFSPICHHVRVMTFWNTMQNYTYKSFAVIFECSLMIARNIIVIPINNFRLK